MKQHFNKNDAFRLFFISVISAMVLAVVLTLIIPEDDSSTFLFWLKQLLYSLLLGVVALAYTKLTDTKFLPATKLNFTPKKLDFLFVAFLVFFLINAMVPVNEWFLTLLENAGFNEPDIGFSLDDIAKNWYVAIPTICIVAPVVEEIIFRGIVANGISTGSKSKLFAILFGGALFSLFHMNPAQTLHQFLLGSLLVYLTFEGGLWLAIFAHFFNNGLAILLSFTIEQSGFYQNNALICLIAGFLLFAVTLLVRKKLLYKATQKTQIELEIFDETGDKTTAGSVVLLVIAVALCSVFWVMTLYI